MSTTKTQQRVSFSTVKNRVPYPDLLEVQLKSFRDFFQMDTTAENRKNEGLYKVFQENFPITDTRNNFVLEFIDYYIDPPRYSIEECLERGLTYSVPLKAKLKLYCTDDEHEDFGVVVQDVYFGTIPYMTERGTFVINGAERVIVSQLHRSPGVFFGQSMHTNGTKLYSARIIPFKGSWIEFATDINNVMYAYIDRKKKLPVTTLLRAIGFEADQQILEIFDLADEVKVTKAALKKAVGRKLAARVLSTWVEDFVDEDTGEVVSIERNNVIVDRETVLQEEHIDQIIESGAKTILLHKENLSGIDFSIIYNTLQKDPCNSEKEAVVYIYRQLRASEPPDEATARDVIEKLFFSDKRYDLGDVGRYRINKKLDLDIDPAIRTLTREDIIAIIKYLIQLINSKAEVDDIDHLSNRRVRTVGEQLSNQFSVGFVRMARTIRERMNVRDNEVFTPVDLINAKTLSSVINSFFGTSQLSQFMDQINPLAEITHKRRLSALGPGGLSRDRAGFEVRDVHYTHYGRLCPIESPEGPNIGLISSLCVYAKISDMGFIETPYRTVTNGQVDLNNADIKYYSAEEEEGQVVAQSNVPIDDEGHFLQPDRIKSRLAHQTHIIRTHFQSVKGSDYCFSLTATKAPISATGCGAGQPPNREVPGRRKQPHKRKKGGRSRVTVRPPFLSSLCLALLSLRFPLLLPFSKFPLAFLALVESKDVRHDTAGYCLDLVLGDVGIVDQLFPSSQIYLRVSQDFVTAGGPCPSFAAAAAPSTPAAPPGVCSGQTAGAVHSPFAAQAPPSACVCSFHC